MKLFALMRWEWQAGDQASGKVLVKLAVGKESQEWIMTAIDGNAHTFTFYSGDFS